MSCFDKNNSGEAHSNFALVYLLSLVLMSGFIFAVLGFADDGDKSQAVKDLERRQKVEILSYFMKDAGDAKVPGTTMAAGLYNQAVGYFKKNELSQARTTLQESIRHDGMNPLAYELLGDIDNLEQKLGEAKVNYETAFQLDANPRIREKLEKLKKESDADKGLSRYDEEHFLIKYQATGQPYDGFELREMLRSAYGGISSAMAYYFNQKIVVLLYGDEEFERLTGMPPWVAGLYDGKVRVPINREGIEDKNLRAIVNHEVAHAFVAGISGRMAPPWINEGLAVYMEGKVQKRDDLVFRSAVKTQTLYTLDQLIMDAPVTEKTDPLMIELFYEQSFHIVAYLIERYGMFKVKQMLEAYGKGKNSEEVFQEILRISTKRFEQEWRETLSVPKKN